MPQSENEILAKAAQRTERLLAQLTAANTELNAPQYSQGQESIAKAIAATKAVQNAIQETINQLPKSSTTSPS